MSVPRSCNACRTAKTRCDAARPACGRCTQSGRPCVYQADQGLVFRNENDAARLRSYRASRPNRGISVFHPVLHDTSVAGPSSERRTMPTDNFLQRKLPWLNPSAVSEVPEPLKRDLQARAVDRFFVNWVLYPANSGLFPGHLHVLPPLYHTASSDSILHCAVRAVAFADMPKGSRDETSSFHAKAHRSYGSALARMRELASDEESLVDDHVLAALLLIDNFEVSGCPLSCLGYTDCHHRS